MAGIRPRRSLIPTRAQVSLVLLGLLGPVVVSGCGLFGSTAQTRTGTPRATTTTTTTTVSYGPPTGPFKDRAPAVVIGDMLAAADQSGPAIYNLSQEGGNTSPWAWSGVAGRNGGTQSFAGDMQTTIGPGRAVQQVIVTGRRVYFNANNYALLGLDEAVGSANSVAPLAGHWISVSRSSGRIYELLSYAATLPDLLAQAVPTAPLKRVGFAVVNGQQVVEIGGGVPEVAGTQTSGTCVVAIALVGAPLPVQTQCVEENGVVTVTIDFDAWRAPLSATPPLHSTPWRVP